MSGLQSEITSENKLDADLIDDSTSTNKFVTTSDINTWNGKQNAISDLDTIRSGASAGATALQPNTAITGATKCKITYDSNGLVTAGADLSSSDITTALGYTPYNSTNPNGYQANILEGVQVNGTDLTISSKKVNVQVPTKISDLTDDTSTYPIDKADTLTGLTASITELNYVDGVTSAIQTQLDNKITKNIAITGATKCKITYDANGLVTAGTDLEASDIPDISTTYQTVINDLSDIRAGANAGATAVQPEELATVATSGQYSDLTGTPTIPTVNDATLTIQKNGTTIDTFTANSSTNKTVNITVPTQASDIGALPDTTDIPTKISDLTDDTATHPIAEATTLTGLTASITELNYIDGVTSSIQTQLDNKITKNTAITGATKCKITYDSNGLVTAGADLTANDIPDISATYQTVISATNKISADYISDGTTNKTVTATEKSTWSGKQDAITGAATTITSNDLTASKALISNDNGKVAASSVTSTELGYLSGVTSAIQTQLNSKLNSNTAITGATKCKITYDTNGLITAGADLEASDIPSLTLSKISDITATASELNILDGATLTTTELNYVDGVTSPIQTQIGTLSNLTTEAQTSLVAAINEIDAHTDTNTSNISTINGLIPNAATTSNQLADKNFVNSSIATNTANFIGTFNSVEELEAYSGTVTNNDYAFVEVTDEYGNAAYDRYKYTTSTTPASWQFEYELNNSSFTAAQWAAINSGATTTNIGQITTNKNAIGTLSSLTTTTKTDLVGALNELDTDKVEKNATITGATKCKITYDSKGLITGGADLNASDIPSLTLSKISDITATASEVNLLDGATLTTTELNYVDGVTSPIQTQIDDKVTKNAAITGATKCKITYDAKGLVTNGADLTANDIPDLSSIYQVKTTAVTHTASTAVGNSTTPVYIANDGTATALSYTISKSVPADAVFTDTTYTTFTGANGSTAGTSGLVPAPTATDNTKYLKGDGTWAEIIAFTAAEVDTIWNSITPSN